MQLAGLIAFIVVTVDVVDTHRLLTPAPGAGAFVVTVEVTLPGKNVLPPRRKMACGTGGAVRPQSFA